MDKTVKFLLLFLKLCSILSYTSAITYTVKIGDDGYLNIVDNKFLSFTVDPRFLFSAHGDLNGKDLKYCMATSLTPAYLRIAGPSTAYMTFHNLTITFTNLNSVEEEHSAEKVMVTRPQTTKALFLDSKEIINKRSIESFGLKKKRFDMYPESLKNTDGKRRIDNYLKKSRLKNKEQLAITYYQWRQFTNWAQNADFDLVFAFNNEKKMANGLWDPNAALDILTLADSDNITKVYWQLGYECRNQSVDDYINDLETLGAIVESFSSQKWKTVGGDISNCLSASSKNDFRDYVLLTEHLADALVLDANSSAHELSRMSEHDRSSLLQLLAVSYTPLWLVDTHSQQTYIEFHRAVDWITSLGYSARNGFDVHFRELVEEEVYTPTLSFYMALMFKHLVGNKVLDVIMESSEAVLFAHCTSLHRMPVPGAVTVYGANLADETARFLLKISRREDGGDIMQFILGNDVNGDIILNGKPLTDANIRPVVTHVRKYKTLLLSLPPKSIGFWVIGNIRLENCLTGEDGNSVPDQKDDHVLENTNNQTTFKTKRSIVDGDIRYDSLEPLVRKSLSERINAINKILRTIFYSGEKVVSRKKRQVDNDQFSFGNQKLRKFVKKYSSDDEPKPRLKFVRKLKGVIPRPEISKVVRQERGRKNAKHSKNKTGKKIIRALKVNEQKEMDDIITSDIGNKTNRKRRSLNTENADSIKQRSEELLSENEIDLEIEKEMKLWKLLHKIHKQIRDLSLEDKDLNEKKHNQDGNQDSNQNENENIDSKDEDQFEVNTKMADDGATINFKEKNKRGFVKSAVNNLVSVLSDLNQNLNRVWNAINILN